MFKEKIEVFVRYCHFSKASEHKKRLPAFSREKCFKNLLHTAEGEAVRFTFFLDAFCPSDEPHFITKQSRHPVIEIRAGNEADSFLQLLNHVASLKLSPETIVYLLEDDYLHRPRWAQVLQEAFTLSAADYVTLYDHADKYFDPSYAQLQAQLFHTRSCHWRTTPSTTNTYAMRHGTLLRDLPIHRTFSEGRTITADHDKFCALRTQGAALISPIPGWSTHVEPAYVSPCIDWEQFLR